MTPETVPGGRSPFFTNRDNGMPVRKGLQDPSALKVRLKKRGLATERLLI